MIENLLRPPRTAAEFVADALRVVGLLSIVVAALAYEPTDAGILAAALPFLLVPRLLGTTAWFDIVSTAVILVAAWSNVIDLYTTLVGWDLVVHFVCTGVLTALTYLALARAEVVPGRGDPGFRTRIPMTLSPAIGLALSALWEMVEWFGHAVITPTISVGYGDTIGDMAAGGLGALIAGALVASVALERTPAESAD